MGMDAGRQMDCRERERGREPSDMVDGRSFNKSQSANRKGQKERQGKFVIMYGNGIMWLTTRRNRKNGKEKEENEKGHGDWSEKESCFIKARGATLVPRSFVHPWGLCDVRVAFEGLPSAAKKSFTGVTFC